MHDNNFNQVIQQYTQMIGPDKAAFDADPIGYSSLAWLKWQMALMQAGNIEKLRDTPSKEDLKSPILWLSKAHALSEAANILVNSQPTWQSMPLNIRGVCDCQYYAIALMLVGYSLETCLKAMHIMNYGIEEFINREKKYFHHDLVALGEFLPQINDKEKAILKTLTHFTTWAGRYPDPGSNRLLHAEEVFFLSEQHQISSYDIFAFSARVMNHVHTFVSS